MGPIIHDTLEFIKYAMPPVKVRIVIGAILISLAIFEDKEYTFFIRNERVMKEIQTLKYQIEMLNCSGIK